MITYILGDTIYFAYNDRVTYGTITNITPSGTEYVYTVVDSLGNTYTVNQSQAYPNAFPLVSPTPTSTSTVTPTITASPEVTPTPTLTISSTVTYPNLFPSNTADGWVAENGQVTSTDNAYINFIRDITSTQPMMYTKTFDVEAQKHYRFNIYYQQGTIRYGKMFLSVDQGTISLYTTSQVTVLENGSLLSIEFSDSGTLPLDLFVDEGSVLTLVVQFFDGPNYDGYPDANFTYRFADTLLQMYGNYEIPLTPTLTPTPTVTPTNSPTVTQTSTATVTPTITITPNISASASPSPSITPTTTPPTDFYKQAILASTPIAYYRLDDTNNIIRDSIGGHDGQLNGSMEQGQPSLSVNFTDASMYNDANSNITVFNNRQDFNYSTNDFTLEFLAQIQTNQVFNNPVLIAKVADPTQMSYTYAFLLNQDGTASFVCYLNGVAITATSSIPVNDNVTRIYHLVRYGRKLTLYIDSYPDATAAIPGNGALDVGPTDLELFGTQYLENSSFTGSLDEVAVYNYALNIYYIVQHYHYALAATPTPTPSVSISYDSTPTPTPTNTVTPTLTASASVTVSPSPTNTATPTLTASASVTASPTVTATPSQTPSVTPSVTGSVGASATPTATISVTPSLTASSTLTPTPTPTLSRTPQSTATPSQTVSVTPSVTGSLGASATPTPTTSITHTMTPSPTTTPTATATVTFTPTTTATVTVSASISATPTVTPTISHTPSVTPSVTPTISNTASVTPTISNTPSITVSTSITPSTTPIPSNTPSATVSASITPTVTPTISVTHSITPTISVTTSITPTISVTPSVTASISVSPTNTPTPTPTISITPSTSLTPSVTASTSITPSITPTISETPSVTPTISVTPSITPTISVTPSVTPTITVSPSVTPTFTPTASNTPTVTPTATFTPTATVTPTVTSAEGCYDIPADISNEWTAVNGFTINDTIGNPTPPSFFAPGGGYGYAQLSASYYSLDFYINSGDTYQFLDIYFGSAYSGSGYCLRLDARTNVTSGLLYAISWTNIGSFLGGSASSQFSFKTDTWYNLTIDMTGPGVVISINGTEKWSTANQQYYSGGWFGINGDDVEAAGGYVANLDACYDGAYPTPTPTVTPTISVSPTGTPAASITPTPTISITATLTPTVTATVTPSATVTPTASISHTPTLTPTVTPSNTASTSLTPTPSPTLSTSLTPTLTPTVTASVTASVTPSITVTPSVTPSLAQGCSNISTSSLTGWNQSGATIVSGTLGNAINVGANGWANMQLPSVSNGVIDAYVYLNGANDIFDLFLLCNSSGVGYILRLDSRAGFNQVAIGTCTSMSGNGNVGAFLQSYSPCPPVQTQQEITISYSSSALNVALNGTTILTLANPTINGSYFGVSGDTENGGGQISNIQFCNNALPTPSATPSPSITATPTVTPSVTPTISVTASLTPSMTASASVTPTVTPSITPSITTSISVTPTISVTISVTPSNSQGAVPTVTATATPSNTPTISVTPSVTPTISPTPVNPSPTPTPSVTISQNNATFDMRMSNILKKVMRATAVASPTPTATISITPTISHSASVTPTISLTPSVTPSITLTANFGNDDPYYQFVQSLLHFDGTSGSTTITDQISGNTWAAGTGAALETTNVKFGTASGLLPGTDGIGFSSTNSNLAIGKQDFTMECFIYVNAAPGSNDAVIFDQRPASTNGLYPTMLVTTSGQLVYYTNGGVITTQSGTGLSTGTWYHVALCRASGVTRMFMNGTQEGTSYTDANNYLFGLMRLGYGAFSTSPTLALNGYIDEFRLTIGVGRYSANFTPPTQAFPNVGYP